MFDQLKDLKDTYESIRTQVGHSKEPLEDLIKMDNFLKTLVSSPGLLQEKDKDYQKFFNEDIISGLFKRFSRERSRDDKLLNVLSSIFEQVLLFFLMELKAGRFNQQFFENVKSLFEYDTMLHNYNYQIPEEELKKLRNQNQEWRKELKEGDLVDAIIDDNTRCSGWSQARVAQVIDDTLHLEFYLDTKSADRYLDRWSVEIAQFETKTKELFDFKAALKVGSAIDCHDKTIWNKSTILDVKEQLVAPERSVKMCLIGYRIYTESGIKTDEQGNYDGWSNRFDEWISLYSPRIQPLFSKTQKGQQDDIDLDDEMDNMIQPEKGMDKAYAVPRLRKCTSSLYIHLINLFGYLKGYDTILDIIENAPIGEDSQFDLTIMSNLVQCVATPSLIYHREFASQYLPKFVELCKKRLKEAPEKSLRDVRREKIESIIKSIDTMNRRLLTKELREKETEILKLEVALVCLKSSFLERRIQGIRDLNQVIKNNRIYSSKNFTPAFLVDWLHKNQVLYILFDPKKTHLQIVQRTNDVLKLLLMEDMLTQEIIEMFWGLAKTDYKVEIYKIINEVSFYLKQNHIDYIFSQIKEIPATNITMEEFQCLSEIGKYGKNDDFKIKVSSFFWEIISNSDQYKEDLVNNCISKFCEMVKNWELARKIDFFHQLAQNLAENKSSIPSIKLFRGIIKDQKDKAQFNSSPMKVNNMNNLNQVVNSQVDDKKELTLKSVLNQIIQEDDLIIKLLNNLKNYYDQANKSTHQINDSRKKLFLVNPKYSHHEEVDERLQFIKYLATVSDFSAYRSKTETHDGRQQTLTMLLLHQIYDLLAKQSRVPSDQEEFFIWCKTSCEQSTSDQQILDLDEVGLFLAEKMKNKELDVKNLPLVGFDFLSQYFLSLNEKEGNLLRTHKPKPKQQVKQIGMTYSYGMNNGVYGPQLKGMNNIKNTGTKQDDDEQSQTLFKLIKLPQELTQVDIIWDLALNCEDNTNAKQSQKVVPKAIDFLIKIYSYNSLDQDLRDQRVQVQDSIIEKCMSILKETTNESTIKRVIEIIKNIIYDAERKGTGDVQQHSALLKGELLEKITIKNKASSKRGNMIISVYSNCTIWEFKKEVAKQLDLAPQYLKLEKGDGSIIKDIYNGKTIGEIGIKNNESLTAFKIDIDEEVIDAPLRGADGKLCEKPLQIFNEWFDMYSDQNGSMTKETCALFIKGCTGEHPTVTDDRILSMFKQYDINNDEKIERQEFIQFYETAARNKPETVRENLRAHNIRNDLKRLIDIKEETSFTSTQMPRYKISTNQEQFDLLISILDRQDQSSAAAWDLIQMLATNQVIYKRVLQLKTAADESGKINWNVFFDNNSVYKLLYTLQIIEAVMEEGEDSNLKRVNIIEDIQTFLNKKIPLPPSKTVQTVTTQGQNDVGVAEVKHENQNTLELNQQQNEDKPPNVIYNKSQSIIDNSEEDKKLKSEWTLMFLENNGFDYILKVLMEKNISQNQISATKEQSFDQIFELKHVAFLLKLLRIFIMAAFSTSRNESSVYEVASLVRRSSSIHSEDQLHNDTKDEVVEGQRFKELQNLLQGPLGEQLIDSINYKTLQVKILQLIAQVLEKKNEMVFEDKLIVENALSLWVSFILHKNELIDDFYQFKGESQSTIKTANDLILNGLLFCSQDKVREEFKFSLNLLANKLMNESNVSQTPLIYLLSLLSQNFKLITDYPCKQYFELFCELIDHYFLARAISADNNLQQQAFDPEQLLILIIDKVKEYNKLAQSNQNKQNGDTTTGGDNEVDTNEVSEQENIYIGLIQLTGKIIDNFDISFSEQIVEQKKLIEEIFANFLFSSVFQHDQQNNLDNLKIRPQKGMRKSGKKQMFGQKSKEAAYKLLNSLIRKSPLLMSSFLENQLVPFMKLIKRQEAWGYSPPGTSERSQRYVGLRNLGCICYLNSLLQQFFMIPAFRYNLLSVDDKLPDSLVEYKGNKIDDNVLHQLQKLMAHLELSERQDFNPYEFCFAFKDLDGLPTNTSEQKDAQEFLSLSFDRIDNLLKNTSRKYLLQSVFGGQTCSQLLCQECGKVKNRIEDFSTLSVTVKDIKSLYDSLKKLIEGEVISDYQCDGCKKKVDISKRTLISQTPNVLIVHLQRIIFNFDTFRNDKINTFFEFPYHLDLKPYSFQEVMSKDKRYLKKKAGNENEDGEEDPKDEEADDQDNQWPEDEDCFEYKLVGVNVHSGTANAGHYWSYINTKRGQDEPTEDDPQWAQTETDPWMEFNDSTVRDFNFEKLKDDCFGGDGKSSDDGGWSFGGSYGKSAYMLFYERRKKRPLKILLSQEEADNEKSDTKNKIFFDSNKNENYKLIDYREGVEDIAPNQIYKQVFEDNTKFGFEKDIYSTEFFEFVKSTLNAVSQLNNKSNEDKQVQGSQNDQVLKKINANAMSVGKKATLEILAKCFYNQGIDEMVQCLLQILQNDDDLCKQFIQQGLQEDNGNYFMELLLECTDPIARQQIAILFKYILNRLKIVEKDYLFENQQVDIKNEKGEVSQIQQPKALCSRFIQRALSDLNTRVAKNWSRFDHFLDILYTFGVGPEADIKNTEQISLEDQTRGLEFFFQFNFVERACDFILGKKSPLLQNGEKRIEMGGSFSNPNFSGIIKLITKMITNEQLIIKYPLSEQSKKMLLHQDLLNVILGASSGSKQFGQCLANMCKDNEKLSKKVAKVYIKSINNSKFDTVKNYLQALKPFLKMNDSLKHQKLEWILGFSQVISRKGYREERYKYGLEFIDKINDDANLYASPIISGALQNALLSQLAQCKGKQDSFAVNCLKEMVSLMAKDDDIARFVYKSAPVTYQTARYSDWIRPYLENQKVEIEKSTGFSYFKAKYDTIVKALTLLEKYEQKCEQFKQEDQEKVQNIINGKDGYFVEAQQDWLAYKSTEVIPHFPPQLIIGKQIGEEKVFLQYDEDPNVKITLTEMQNEYTYSNPTGYFNLSLPHLEFRTNHYSTLSYAQYKKMQSANQNSNQKKQQRRVGNSSDEDEDDDDETTDDTVTSDTSTQQVEQPLSPLPSIKKWFEEKREGSVLLKVSIGNKGGDTLTAQIYITVVNEDGIDEPNILAPVSFLNEYLYGEDVKVVAHLQKVDPAKPWPKLTVRVETQIKVTGNKAVTNINQPSYNQMYENVMNHAYNQGGSQSGSSMLRINVIDTSKEGLKCSHCQKQNEINDMTCQQCGNYISVEDDSNSYYQS